MFYSATGCWLSYLCHLCWVIFIFDIHLYNLHVLPPVLQVEPPAKAVTKAELAALPTDPSLPSMRERAHIAMRASGAAMEASQRAAAYSAAASSAASRAAEAAEQAAAAAAAVQVRAAAKQHSTRVHLLQQRQNQQKWHSYCQHRIQAVAGALHMADADSLMIRPPGWSTAWQVLVCPLYGSYVALLLAPRPLSDHLHLHCICKHLLHVC